VRVIAGKFRSRRLVPVASLDLRPTSDRLRETLFDVLTAGNPAELEKTAWLDLFAGTGAVGIEALSRGARMVHFVERNRAVAALIRSNLASLGVTGDSEIHQQSVAAALRELERRGEAFDYCFLDPPYAETGAYAAALTQLSRSRLLAPQALVIAEHDVHFDPGDRFGELERYRRLDQGDASLSFYRVARIS
jgi:16S rRNA (guanine966-N2)-methyltransferase